MLSTANDVRACKYGVDARTADADAEGIEHHVSEATLEALRRHLAKLPRSR
jgi:DtxR family manganese transport transcriptional regulator